VAPDIGKLYNVISSPKNLNTVNILWFFSSFFHTVKVQWWINNDNFCFWVNYPFKTASVDLHLSPFLYHDSEKAATTGSLFSKKRKRKKPKVSQNKTGSRCLGWGISMSNVPLSPLKHDWRVGEGGLELSIAWTHLGLLLITISGSVDLV